MIYRKHFSSLRVFTGKKDKFRIKNFLNFNSAKKNSCTDCQEKNCLDHFYNLILYRQFLIKFCIILKLR